MGILLFRVLCLGPLFSETPKSIQTRPSIAKARIPEPYKPQSEKQHSHQAAWLHNGACMAGALYQDTGASLDKRLYFKVLGLVHCCLEYIPHA